MSAFEQVIVLEEEPSIGERAEKEKADSMRFRAACAALPAYLATMNNQREAAILALSAADALINYMKEIEG